MKIKTCKHEAHNSNFSQRLKWALEKIQEKKLRITNPRKEILAILAESRKPLSSDEVFKLLKKGKSDLVTVYRSLTTMEELGILRKHDLGDSVRRYELAQEEHHHHHYIHCRSCGSVEAFEGCAFEQVIYKSLKNKGYQHIQHNLDVQAICSACA